MACRQDSSRRRLLLLRLIAHHLCWANCPSPETLFLNWLRGPDLLRRHREGFADGREDVILATLIQRQSVVGHEARMLFLFGVFHWTVLPAFGALLCQPRIVTRRRGRFHSCRMLREMKLDAVARRVLLPFGSEFPRRLRMIAQRVAVSAIRLVTNLRDLLNCFKHSDQLSPCLRAGTRFALTTCSAT